MQIKHIKKLSELGIFSIQDKLEAVTGVGYRAIFICLVAFSLTSIELMAQSGVELLFGPQSGPAVKYPNKAEYRGGTASSQSQHEAKASFRLSKTRSTATYISLGSELSLWDRGPKRKLWTPEGNIVHSRALSGGESYGAVVGHSSPSDKPYHSAKEVNYSGTAFYRVPHKAGNAFLFMLNYSNRRGILQNIPLPLFSYFYVSENRKLQMLLGLPFFVNYNFTQDFWAKASLLMPSLLGLELGTKVWAPFQLRIRSDWNYRSYLLAGRSNSKEQLFYESKNLALSLGSPMSPYFSWELRGGWLFDRRFFLSEGFFDREKHRVERLKASPFLLASIEAQF